MRMAGLRTGEDASEMEAKVNIWYLLAKEGWYEIIVFCHRAGPRRIDFSIL